MRRTRGAIGLVAATLPLLIAAAVAFGGGSTAGDDSTRSELGLERLNQLRKDLARAEDEPNKASSDFEGHLREAQQEKRKFVEAGFDGYSYLLDCDAGAVMLFIDQTNTALHRGYHQQKSGRGESLREAVKAARELSDFVAGCAPGANAAVASQALAQVRELAGDHEDGEISFKNYNARRTEIRERYLNLLRTPFDKDLTVGDCAVPTFQEVITRLSQFITGGLMVTPEFELGFEKPANAEERRQAEKSALRARRKYVERAHEVVAELTQDWKACSPPACDDGLDDDGDGTTDSADIGCLTGSGGAYEREDQSEQDSAFPTNIYCPPAGNAGPATGILITRNDGDDLLKFKLVDPSDGFVYASVDTRVDSNWRAGSTNVGPDMCGPGTSTTISWEAERTGVTWEFTITKDDKDVVPVPRQVVAIADTI